MEKYFFQGQIYIIYIAYQYMQYALLFVHKSKLPCAKRVVFDCVVKVKYY